MLTTIIMQIQLAKARVIKEEERRKEEERKNLRKSYDSDLEYICKIEKECYKELEVLEEVFNKETQVQYEKIIKAHKEFVPSEDERIYNENYACMCEIENECYEEIKRLEVPFNKASEGLYEKIKQAQKDFDVKYKPVLHYSV